MVGTMSFQSNSCQNYPEILVKGTKRSRRIILVALMFVISYLLFDQNYHSDLLPPTNRMNVVGTASTTKGQTSATKIHIFYNLFTKSAQDEERVRQIVNEQFNLIDPTIHDTNVTITSIGHQLSSIPNSSYIEHHYNEGGEDLTLYNVWQYCRNEMNNNHIKDDDIKVIYLHSKGSYHPNEANHKLRNFVTRGALSTECANLPSTCNVCSSRMSPLPHPHTSGNMWLARCNYISKLINPLSLKEGLLPNKFHEDNPCKGRGRYLGEHWVHSHPSVQPCDLYPGKEFTWAHLRVPPIGEIQKELKMAPRFKFKEYVLPGMCMDEYPETLEINEFVKLRKENYDLLYNITDLEEDWWGWEFLRRTIA